MREFWIVDADDNSGLQVKESISKSEARCANVIHVIEISALEALKKERDEETKRADSHLQEWKVVKQERDESRRDLEAIRKYCDPHLKQMWAASIAGIIDKKDFRDVLAKYPKEEK